MRHDTTDARCGLQVIGTRECLDLMRSVPIGRIVFTDRALPAIQPVNFVLDADDSVIIRTVPGSKLAAATRGAIVAFEADDFDEASRTGWSVTLIGPARAVTSPAERDRLARLPLTPWSPGMRDHFIRVTARQVSGRRIVRPPQRDAVCAHAGEES
ncbi:MULTISPECIES: pyridoxamine 5'-phosphate oxidase family protein [Actinomadura]|jgi:nitroimidazol reductase NimA-like FMN-containing flavoprotein (pyridoxamine 5'-phosphate oxidase superfamily)|uniref:Pyridoxamine 5'-phosphate oxidase family protein n=1 Tax=Actinomadura keratinilytica TaxID=547461 RepID=A0ABP7Z4T5_9ACTN|nr:pyridoxamine 5'-phosphate oxidase family protein [Actinomadura sp. NBRC 104425]GLZ12921.1 pyridoxamine 5'-phosphate oxidase [Actinomadura sp. NBRC 104425]